MIKVLDIFALEQFLMDLSGDTQRWVRKHQPKSMEEDPHLAEALWQQNKKQSPTRWEKWEVLLQLVRVISGIGGKK